jgi:hypothetical protein
MGRGSLPALFPDTLPKDKHEDSKKKKAQGSTQTKILAEAQSIRRWSHFGASHWGDGQQHE